MSLMNFAMPRSASSGRWASPSSATASSVKKDHRISEVFQAFIGSPESTVQELSAFYRNNMCGVFGRYSVFAWDGDIRGVEKPDPITFEELIGYETQQEQLIRNTRTFP